MTDHIADIIKYAALVQNDRGEVLFCRKYNKTDWINIGGRLEEGETPIQCLQRELREELNCEIVTAPLPVKFLETPPTPALDDPNKTVQIIWYKVELIGNPVASGEIEEIRWVDPKNPDVNLSPQIREFLLPSLKRFAPNGTP